MSEPDKGQPEPQGDWQTQRRAERRARRAGRARADRRHHPRAGRRGAAGADFWPGAAEELVGPVPADPAVGALVAAIRNYRSSGDTLTGGVIGSLISAAIFVVLAVALFFDVAWGAFWPVLLIAIGLGILARDYWPGRD